MHLRSSRRHHRHAVSLLLLLGALLAFRPATSAAAEKPPTRAQAIGDLAGATALERVAYEDDPAFFQPIHTPTASDWQAQHPEPGQTFPKYRSILPEVKPSAVRHRLYVLPLGDFGPGHAPALDHLRDYCAAFFSMDTRVLPPVPIADVPATRRINKNTQKQQLLTPEILAWLYQRKPQDAYALIAVTLEDLYPEEAWNFVFGQASLRGGVGVFSFARYDPAFFGEPRDAQTPALLFKRSCKVLSHEMGHMFGIQHCAFFECVMNGSNHMQEADGRPMHLCPVCLRKLQLATGFDLVRRETALKSFYEAHSIPEEIEWSTRRIEKMRQAH